MDRATRGHWIASPRKIRSSCDPTLAPKRSGPRRLVPRPFPETGDSGTFVPRTQRWSLTIVSYKEPGVSNFRNVIVFPKVGVA
jgi:hypothetical protein